MRFPRCPQGRAVMPRVLCCGRSEASTAANRKPYSRCGSPEQMRAAGQRQPTSHTLERSNVCANRPALAHRHTSMHVHKVHPSILHARATTTQRLAASIHFTHLAALPVCTNHVPNIVGRRHPSQLGSVHVRRCTSTPDLHVRPRRCPTRHPLQLPHLLRGTAHYCTHVSEQETGTQTSNACVAMLLP